MSVYQKVLFLIRAVMLIISILLFVNEVNPVVYVIDLACHVVRMCAGLLNLAVKGIV